MVFAKGFLSFEDKSRAINGDGVDSQLADLINKWHKPGMNLCVGKPEYKTIIESVLVSICSLSCIVIFLNNFECHCSRDSFQKIPCRMCCQTVLEIMWGIQQQMRTLVPREKSKLTKEDRLPTSQGLMKFLSNCGFDVKPEMVSSLVGLDKLTCFLIYSSLLFSITLYVACVLWTWKPLFNGPMFGIEAFIEKLF